MAILGPFDFRGGYSPGYDLTSIPDGRNYATTMVNCYSKNAYIAPRWGRDTVNSAALNGNVTGITAWKDTPNSKVAVVAVANGKVYIGDFTSFALPGTVVMNDKTAALNAANFKNIVTFDSLNAILVGSGNSSQGGVPFKITAYNANAALLGGSPPSGDCVKQVNNFIFLSRNISSSTTQSKVYWSNVNDPETWTAANVLDFNKNDGEPIMALGSIGTDLYIFKQSSIGRLGTTTLTVSGAVTLGPLVTVIRGVGCCGPNALDNLPNGNIAFVGYDNHFYEFDGSSLVDLSRQPVPGVNAYDSGTYYAGENTNYGLGASQADTNVCVKVIRGINEVWISYQTSLNSLIYPCYAYSFENRIWQGQVGKGLAGAVINALCFTTIPIASIASLLSVESAQIVLWGTGNGTGNIMGQGDTTRPYPGDDTTPQAFFVGTIIPLGRDGSEFIPRSICFETSHTTTSGATLSAISLYADFDVYTPTITGTTKRIYNSSGQQPARVIVNIPFTADAVGTNIFPRYLSLLWAMQGTGTGTNSEIVRLGRFWLSDEVIR